jgi:hypothetical protein
MIDVLTMAALLLIVLLAAVFLIYYFFPAAFPPFWRHVPAFSGHAHLRGVRITSEVPHEEGKRAVGDADGVAMNDPSQAGAAANTSPRIWLHRVWKYRGNIEPVCPGRRLTDGSPWVALWGDPMRLSSRRQLSSALAVVGSCLGVYAILAVTLHWLKNHGVVAYKSPPASIEQYSDASFVATDAKPLSSVTT